MKTLSLLGDRLHGLFLFILINLCWGSLLAQVNISNGVYFDPSIQAPAGQLFYRIHTFRNDGDPWVNGTISVTHLNAPNDPALGLRAVVFATGSVDLSTQSSFYDPVVSPFISGQPLNGITPFATLPSPSAVFGQASYFNTSASVNSVNVASNAFIYVIEEFEAAACPSATTPVNFVELEVAFSSSTQTMCNNTSGSVSACTYSNTGNIEVQQFETPSFTVQHGGVSGSTLSPVLHTLTDENNCSNSSKVARSMSFTLTDASVIDPQLRLDFNRHLLGQFQLLEVDPASVRISFTLYTDEQNTAANAIVAQDLILSDFLNPTSGVSNFNHRIMESAASGISQLLPSSITTNVADPYPSAGFPTNTKWPNTIDIKPSLKDNGDEVLTILRLNFSNLNATASIGSGGINTSSNFDPTAANPNFLVIYPGSSFEISYEAEFVNYDEFSDGTGGTQDYTALKEEIPFLHTETYRWLGTNSCSQFFDFRKTGTSSRSYPQFNMSAHAGGFLKGSYGSDFDVWNGDIETMVVDFPISNQLRGSWGTSPNGYTQAEDPLAVDWENSTMEFVIDLERGFSIPCPNMPDHNVITGLYDASAATNTCASPNFGYDQGGVVVYQEGAPAGGVAAPVCGTGNIGTGSYVLPQDVFEIVCPNGDVIYPDAIHIEPITSGVCAEGQRWRIKIPMNRFYGYSGNNLTSSYVMENADLRFKVQAYCPASEPQTQYIVKAYVIPAYCDESINPAYTYTTLPITPNDYVNGTCNHTISPNCVGERNKWLVGKTSQKWTLTCPGCKTPGVAVIPEDPVRHEDFIGWKDSDDDGIADVPLQAASPDSINRGLIRHGDVMTVNASSYLYDPAVFLANDDTEENCNTPQCLWGGADEFNTNALANPPSGGYSLKLNKWVFDLNIDAGLLTGRDLFYPLIHDASPSGAVATSIFEVEDDVDYNEYMALATDYPSQISISYKDGVNPTWYGTYTISESELTWLNTNELRIALDIEDVYAEMVNQNPTLSAVAPEYYQGNEGWLFDFALQFLTDVDASAYQATVFSTLGNTYGNSSTMNIALNYFMYITDASIDTLLVDKVELWDHPSEYEAAVHLPCAASAIANGSSCSNTDYPAHVPSAHYPTTWWCEAAGGNIQLAAYSNTRVMLNQYPTGHSEYSNYEKLINESDDLAKCIEVGPIMDYRTGCRGSGSINHFDHEVRPGALADSLIFYVPAPYQPEAIYILNSILYASGNYSASVNNRQLKYIIPLTGSKSMVGENGITVSAAPNHTMPDEFYPKVPAGGFTYAGNGGAAIAGDPLFSTANKTQHWKVSIPLTYFHENEGILNIPSNNNTVFHLDGTAAPYPGMNEFPLLIGDEHQLLRTAIYYSVPQCVVSDTSYQYQEDCAFRQENNSYYYYSGRTSDLYGVNHNNYKIRGFLPSSRGTGTSHGLQPSDFLTSTAPNLHPSYEDFKLMLPSCIPSRPLTFASSPQLISISTNVPLISNYQPEFEDMANANQMKALFDGAVPAVYPFAVSAYKDATARNATTGYYTNYFRPYLFFDQRANYALSPSGNTSPIVDADGEFEFEFILSDDVLEELVSIVAPCDFTMPSPDIITALNQDPLNVNGINFTSNISRYELRKVVLEGLYFYLEPTSNSSYTSPGNLFEHVQILSVESPQISSSFTAFTHDYDNGSLAPIKFADANGTARLFELPILPASAILTRSERTIRVRAKFDCADPALFAQLNNVNNANTSTAQEFPFRIVVNYNCNRNESAWNPTKAADWQAGVNTSEELTLLEAAQERCSNNRVLTGYAIDAPTLDYDVEILPVNNYDPCQPEFEIVVNNLSNGNIQIESLNHLNVSGLSIPSSLVFPIEILANSSEVLTGFTLPLGTSCSSPLSPISVTVNASSYCASCDLINSTSCLTYQAVYDYAAHPMGITLESSNVSVTSDVCGQGIGSATVLATHGCGATNYVWSNGATTASITQLNAGVYTVTATDANGCTASTSVTIGGSGANPALSVSNDIAICEGQNTMLSATVASTYVWSPSSTLSDPNSATPIASPTSTTTYTVTGYSSAGCSSTAQVTVTVNPLPVLTVGNNISICEGASTTLSVSGASSYAWSPATSLNNPNSATPIATPTNTTTYTVTGTDANGCFSTEQVTVTVNPLPVLTVGNDVPICEGASTTLSVSGASSYVWSPAASLDNANSATPIATPTSTTTYTVKGTDANGCSSTDQVTVMVNPLPVLTVGNDVSICDGLSTTLSVSGASNYVWSPAASLNNANSATPIATPTSTTTYTVIGTDANGCSSTEQVTVTVNPLPNVIASYDKTICEDATTSITATGAIDFEWSPVGSLSDPSIANPIASPSVTTTYTVTGTDANGCSNTNQVTITIQPLPTADAGLDQTICLGQSVTLGGSPTTNASPATFLWSPATGLSDHTIANPVATPSTTTTYTVTVSDALKCAMTDEVTIFVEDGFELEAKVICAANPEIDYEIEVSVAGGAAPYTYDLNVVGVPGVIQSQTSSNNNATFWVIQTGVSYTVVVTDNNGCTQSFGPIAISATPLNVSISNVNHPVCLPIFNGSIDITPVGGIAPYSYQWSGPNGYSAQQEDITGLEAGNYTVTVTDAAGCTTTATQLLKYKSDLKFEANIEHNLCDQDNGMIEIQVSDGTPPYTYQWSNGGNNPIINNLSSGVYTLTVTDANGCQHTETYTVLAGNSLNAQVVQVNAPSCSGANDGSVVLDIQNGTPVFTLSVNGTVQQYIYQTGQFTYSGLSSGNQAISIVDNNGCEVALEILVPEIEPIAVRDLQFVQCRRQGRRRANLLGAITGGTAPYTIQLNGGQTQTISAVGTFTFLNVNPTQPIVLTVIDANGCQWAQSLNLAFIPYAANNTPVIQPTSIITHATCGNNGIISIVPSFYAPNLVYSIDGGATWSLLSYFTGLAPGTYTMAIATQIEVNGVLTVSPCISRRRAIIRGRDIDLRIVSVRDSRASCGFDVEGCREYFRTPFPAPISGRIRLAITGGTAPFTIQIKRDGINLPSIITSLSNYTLTNLQAGLYELEVTDANGCVTQSLTQVIGQQVAFDLWHSVQNQTIQFVPIAAHCHCPSPGYIVNIYQEQTNGGLLLADGPYTAAPFSFPFNGIISSNTLQAGNYVIEIRDCYGCVRRETVRIFGNIVTPFKTAPTTEADVMAEIEQRMAALENQNEMKVYPNPTKGEATYVSYRLNDAAQQLSVYGASGRLVWRKHLDTQMGQEVLPIAQWEQGVYFVEIITENEERLRKKLMLIGNN